MRLRSRLRTVALACLLVGATALAGCGDRSSDDATAGDGSTNGDQSAASATAPEPRTTIPDDFPLSAGMAGPEDDIPTSRTGTGLRDLELCGTSPLRGLDSRDRMVADNSGGEALNTRELLLLGSPQTATDAARSLAELPAECDVRTDKSGWETTTEVRESPFGPAPSAVLVQTYTLDGEPTPGVRVIHVVPAGAGLLVTWIYGEWDDIDEGVASTLPALQETVSALEIFDDGSTPTGEPTEEPTEEPAAAAVDIPADFPLDAGMEEPSDDYEITEPSAEADGMGEVEMCGRVVWPHSRTADVGATRRLVTGASGPESFDGRELIVHADADAAVEAMTTTRDAIGSCRTFDNQVWTPLDRDTGYDTVTVGLTYADGLGSSVFQVTRVGSAVLMVQTYGEGSLASLDEQADGVAETTGKIVPAMCVFTKTGC